MILLNIHQLYQHAGQNIVDYVLLKSILSDYAHPRGKISAWLKSGDLIRVKKGLYVFATQITKEPYSLELLANLIYGPSVLSLNTALSYHGLIPEAVHTMTSITNRRNKKFDTPVGTFSYHYMHTKKLHIGVDIISLNPKISFSDGNTRKSSM